MSPDPLPPSVPSPSSPASRWWTRALPLLAVLTIAGGGAALASPAARHQLEVSTTREPARYVELAFADETAARTCDPALNPAGLLVRVSSHLEETTTLRWLATRSGSGGATTTRTRGDLQVAPGHSGDFVVALPRRPRAAYTITIALRGRTERLALHCTEGQA